MLKNNEHIGTGHCCAMHCLSWTAIIAGTLVAIGLSFLLNLFGLAIGLTAYTTSPEGHQILAVGGYFGMVISTMIALFVAGWISGYLGNGKCSNKKFGMLYGFLTWCMALVLGVALAGNPIKLINIKKSTLAYNEFILQFSNTARTAPNTDVIKADIKADINNLEKENIKSIGKSLFLTFLLFFVGAIMSAFGGYTGIRAKENCQSVSSH